MKIKNILDFHDTVYKAFVSLPQKYARQDDVLDLYTSTNLSGSQNSERGLLEDSFYYSQPLLPHAGLQIDENGTYFPHVFFADSLARQQYMICEQINHLDNLNSIPASFKRHYQIYQYEIQALLVDISDEQMSNGLINRLYQEGISGCIIQKDPGAEVLLFRSSPIKHHIECDDLSVICSREQKKIIFESVDLQLPFDCIYFNEIDTSTY